MDFLAQLQNCLQVFTNTQQQQQQQQQNKTFLNKFDRKVDTQILKSNSVKCKDMCCCVVIPLIQQHIHNKQNQTKKFLNNCLCRKNPRSTTNNSTSIQNIFKQI
eukprot:TRINITY_DN2731_c0_g2_i1.p2 TRINITY_DN2731_c0_g2~~TRINITY_DN2731_c0_g2_i1.p2  ORF type:complete len:104 (+),score=2.15 TRINITY_DN2731_c0_g2_i1:301-612(+)